jgi:DNA-binding LacI/PurR family transcriptional regulator
MVVTRYDGLRARTCEPPLTAVDLHLDRAASDAVELLLGRLRGDTATPSVAVSPRPRVIPRASSVRAARP